MAKLADRVEKIADVVVEGYKKIEDGAVGGYKKVEESAVDGFNKVADKFIDVLFTKEGETVEEAKARLAKEQEERGAQAKAHGHVEVNIPDSSEIVKRNLEASKNAGKR